MPVLLDLANAPVLFKRACPKTKNMPVLYKHACPFQTCLSFSNMPVLWKLRHFSLVGLH